MHDIERRRTRLFQNGNSQAVRIPKELAYPRLDMEMEIERRGDTLVIRPARQHLIGLARAFQAVRPRLHAGGPQSTGHPRP